MTTKDQVNELLDKWEDVIASSVRLSLDEFVAQHLQRIAPNVIKAFRRKVVELAAIDRRLAQVAGVPAGGDLPLNVSTPAAHSTNDGNLCFTRGGLSLNSSTPAVHLSLSHLQSGIQPIPGYALVSRLGRGGFGEVWKAESPGRFHVALKFVPLGGRVGEVEERSLDVIKDVRHPNLLSIFGTWRIGDWLIIATELADRTLLDRFHEARNERHEGIPRSELFRYMAEAAKGIDALNDPGKSGRKRIQHRDIKPQNLLLSGGSVKVGDFGLARLIQHDVTGHTGSLTFAYAAPECFDGTTSNHTDQYSLAITYCHLRGGRLPFDGTPVEIMEGHRKQPPDLSMLPAEERPAVAKALAKRPNDRWKSCLAFTRALVAASQKKGGETPFGDQPGDASTGLFAGFGVLYLTILAAVVMTAAVGTYLLSGKPVVSVPIVAEDAPTEPEPIVAGGGPAEPEKPKDTIHSPVFVKPVVETEKPKDRTSEDMKALQGEWLCVAEEEIGKVIDDETLKKEDRRVTIMGNQFTMMRTKPTRGGYTGIFEVDASNSHFDFVEKGGAHNIWIGIYELDGDTLKLCYRYNRGGALRPTKFGTDADKPNISVFYTYKRVDAENSSSAAALLLREGNLTDQDADGWQPLFNGKSIAGWTGDTSLMTIENGVLVNHGRRGIVSPPGEFGDVEIEIEFRLQDGGNSGLGICYAGIGNPAEMGLEIQMLDDKGNPGVGDTGQCGAVWKLAATKSGQFKRWPAWNRFRVTTLQDAVKVELNGVLVTDTTRTIMKRKDPNHIGLLRTSGQVCLYPHTGCSEYRNFRIRTVNPQR